MKITGTKSYILVEVEGKRIQIDGELTETPLFYADKNSINYWEKGNKKIYLSDQEKLRLMNSITVESSKEGYIPIIFD